MSNNSIDPPSQSESPIDRERSEPDLIIRDEAEWKKENIRPFEISSRLSERRYYTFSIGEESESRESCIPIFDQNLREEEGRDRQEEERCRYYDDRPSLPPEIASHVYPLSSHVHRCREISSENIWISPLRYDNHITPQIE